jgi:hypothetical protein
MSIINAWQTDTGVVLRKHKMAFLSQNNDLQDELTIEESIFASDNETWKWYLFTKQWKQKTAVYALKLLGIIAPDWKAF